MCFFLKMHLWLSLCLSWTTILSVKKLTHGARHHASYLNQWGKRKSVSLVGFFLFVVSSPMCLLELCLCETRWKFPNSSLFCLGFHPISESGTSWVKLTREASVSCVQFQNSRREFTGPAYFTLRHCLWLKGLYVWCGKARSPTPGMKKSC